MNILILGGSGRLGAEVWRQLTSWNNSEYNDRDLNIIAPQSLHDTYSNGTLLYEALDITNRNSLEEYLSKYDPDVVINCAAMTDTTLCESNHIMPFMINAWPLRTIASWCHDIGCRLIHVSTDYVFGGWDQSRYPDGLPAMMLDDYAHGDILPPGNMYGLSKMEAEHYITNIMNPPSSMNPGYTIIRTSNLFGGAGKNPTYANKVLAKAKAGGTITVVDKYTSPTYVPHLADVIVDIALRLWVFDVDNTRRYANAVEHVVGGPCTYLEFTRVLLYAMGYSNDIVVGDYPSRVVHPSIALQPSIYTDSWRNGLINLARKAADSQ